MTPSIFYMCHNEIIKGDSPQEENVWRRNLTPGPYVLQFDIFVYECR